MTRNTKRYIRSVLVVLLCLFIGLGAINAQEPPQGTTISILNVRTGPSIDNTVLTGINAGVRVVMEGRNSIGNWILIHTPDNSIRGWVASRYVAFDEGINLAELPVTGERLTGSSPPPSEAATTSVTVSSTGTQGATIDVLNVRAGPGIANTTLTQINAHARVVIEGRNIVGDWILIHTPDSTIRGWVASRYVAFDTGVNLADLPVVNEFVNQTSSPMVTPQETSALSTIDALHHRLLEVPVFHNATSSTVYTIFQRGRALGNNPRVFMKVGDSMTSLQPFVLGFGMGMYDLGGYGYLQTTIDFFSAPLNSGEPNSFIRYGLSIGEGFQSGFVLDPVWTNPTTCPVHREPLLCEYDINKPAVALVLFGPIDVQFSTPDYFRANMTRVTQELTNRGVIPVLSTFPSANWFNWEASITYNNIIIDVAEQFDVPLINLWQATQSLPGQGINDDGFHLSTGRTHYLQGLRDTDESTPYRFTGEEELFGVTLRNLLTLQMLDTLRHEVLTR